MYYPNQPPYGQQVQYRPINVTRVATPPTVTATPATVEAVQTPPVKAPSVPTARKLFHVLIWCARSLLNFSTMVMFVINPVNWLLALVKHVFQFDYRSAYLEMLANALFILTISKSESVLIPSNSGRLLVVSYKLFKFFVFVVPIGLFIVGEVSKGIAWIVAQVPFPDDEFEGHESAEEHAADNGTVNTKRQSRSKVAGAPSARTKTPG